MTNANLTLVIDALNNSTSTLRGLKSDIKGVEDQAKKASSGLDNFTKRVFTLAAVRIGAQGIRSAIDSLGGLTKAAQEQARVSTQLNAVLASTAGAAGVTADQAKNLATAFQGSTKFMDEQVLSAENVLLTFTNIKDNIFPQTTAAVLDLSTALGQDLQSSAVQIGKALNDPIAGVTALRRVGVSFTEQQQDQIKVLVESGHALEAQKLILAELNKEFGGSASAMTPFEKKLDDLKDKLADVQEGIGRALIPTLSAAFGGLAELGNAFSTNGVEASLLRIQISILNVALKAEDAVTKINNLGKPVSNFLNDVNEWSTKRAKELGNFLGTRHDNEAEPFRTLDPVLGPPVPLTGIAALKQQLEEQLLHLGEDQVGANSPVDKLRTGIDDLGTAAKTAGDALKGVISGLTGIGSDLFSKPTREMALLQLQKDSLSTDVSQFTGGVTSFAPGNKSQAAIAAAGQAALDAQSKAIDQQISDLERQHKIMQDQLVLADKTLLTEGQLQQRFVVLKDITETLTGKIASTAGLLDKEFRQSINDVIKTFGELTKPSNPDGSHAAGLGYVPFDGYTARLHRGERVLNAQEASTYNNQRTNNVNVHVAKIVIQPKSNRWDQENWLNQMTRGFSGLG